MNLALMLKQVKSKWKLIVYWLYDQKSQIPLIEQVLTPDRAGTKLMTTKITNTPDRSVLN